MLVTICTIRQLPQAFALADSFTKFSANGKSTPVVIGLADDPARLPVGFVSPYPLLPISDLLAAEQLSTLSAAYTPTEFRAACKPLLLAAAFDRYPDADTLLYADPNIQFLAPLTPVWEQLATANTLLTPFITRPPRDNYWPDEKFFQNVGLYSADFLALRRSAETDRLLRWWDDRVRERAYLNFCAGLCLDQIWLMHVLVFFQNVVAVHNPGWHLALWNLPERTLRREPNGWLVNGPASQQQPALFINFKGLLNPDEGFFPYQNRFQLSERPEVTDLLTTYQQAISTYTTPQLMTVRPTYGQQPEPAVLRGWRHTTVQSMQAVTSFIDQVYLPVIR